MKRVFDPERACEPCRANGFVDPATCRCLHHAAARAVEKGGVDTKVAAFYDTCFCQKWVLDEPPVIDPSNLPVMDSGQPFRPAERTGEDRVFDGGQKAKTLDPEGLMDDGTTEH